MGVNTAIFSLSNSLILKSLPVEHSDRLVRVTPETSKPGPIQLWEQLQAHQAVLEGVFAWSSQHASFDLSTGGEADLANGLWVSASFFDVLGVQPILGRTSWRPTIAAEAVQTGPSPSSAIASATPLAPRTWLERRS